MQNKESRYFKLFIDICKAINSSLDLKEVLVLITENIVKLRYLCFSHHNLVDIWLLPYDITTCQNHR